MKLLRVVSLEDARDIFCNYWQPCLLPVKTCDVSAALDHVLAEDVYSAQDVPPFSRSTVDGYAVLAGNTQAAGENAPVFLRLAGSVDMGTIPEFSLEAGTCAYVPTGGALPQGADGAVMVEYCDEFPPNQIALNRGVACGDNLILRGEDIAVGELLLRRGTRLRPQELGALAAVGIRRVKVYASVRITIYSTGDELETPGNVLPGGKIYDINTQSLAAMARRLGMEVVRTTVLPDQDAKIEEALRLAEMDSDFVVVSGGSSQGKKDLTAALFSRLTGQDVDVHGLALRPGKPTILACHQEQRTVFVGLPGHPAAAILVFELLVGWSMRKIMGMPESPCIPAKAGRNLAGDAGKTTCVLCSMQKDAQGYTACPILGKSGLITALTRADGYFLIERNQEGVVRGEQVDVHLLQ